MVSVAMSLVCTVQLPSLFTAPSLRLHPDGMPDMVRVTGPTRSADGSASARLMGAPATPAGRLSVALPMPGFPAKSVQIEVPVPLDTTCTVCPDPEPLDMSKV